MKTHSLLYKNGAELKDFISKNDLSEYRSVLVQVFTGVCDPEFIRSVTTDIKENLPEAAVIGSTTAGEIFNGDSVENETIICMSIFEKTTVTTHATARPAEN
jgi:hypothetical protein